MVHTVSGYTANFTICSQRRQGNKPGHEQLYILILLKQQQNGFRNTKPMVPGRINTTIGRNSETG
jgi:hypothetical protein